MFYLHIKIVKAKVDMLILLNSSTDKQANNIQYDVYINLVYKCMNYLYDNDYVITLLHQ